MPSPGTRKNSPKNSAKKELTSAQKKAIKNSLKKFNSTVLKRFNAGNPPSQKAMLAALKALRYGGGTRRRR